MCRFVGCGTFNVSRAEAVFVDLDADCRHCKGAARDRLAERLTVGGCWSGSAAGRRLETSVNAVVSKQRACWRRLPSLGWVKRLPRATLVRGIIRTVVWCFLRDRDVMGVAFLDTGCRNLDKPRFLAQLVDGGCPTIAHSGS